MTTKTEENSRNGTLSINTQTTSQRLKFGQRFRNGLGVGVDRVGAGNIFPDSPIGNTAIRTGVTADGQEIGASQTVYQMFASVVDESESLTAGFGFGSTDIADVSLNYQHDQNPFLDGVYTNLTTGRPAGSTETGLLKRYIGYPDLVPPDINSVTTDTSDVASEELARVPDGQVFTDKNFGSETSTDRSKNSQTSSLGFFAGAGEGNQTTANAPDTLGTYFKNTGSVGS